MTHLLLALSLAFAAPQSFPMNDAGVTLNLAPSWEMTRWSDWDFKARTKDGTQLKIWTTPFQVEVTPAAAKAWADMYAAEMKKEGFDDVEVSEVNVDRLAGRPTARVKLTMRPRSGGPLKAVYYGVAFTGAGQVIHAYTISLARNSERTERQLLEVVERLELTKAPLTLPASTVSTSAGFAATLPEGWRTPLAEELPAVLTITAAMGEEELAPERCWVALRPPPVGDPDVMFACSAALYLGPVDEHSFSGQEPEVRERFFGRLDPPIPAATPAALGDRTGFYFSPPQGKDPIRLVVAPFGAGEVMMLWAIGKQIDAPALDADLARLLPTVTFVGPDGGKPRIGFDRWLSYYLKYRFFSPVVLGPLVLLLGVVVLVARALRKKPVQDV